MDYTIDARSHAQRVSDRRSGGRKWRFALWFPLAVFDEIGAADEDWGEVL